MGDLIRFDFVLPVDSPDEEDVVSGATFVADAFTRMLEEHTISRGRVRDMAVRVH